MGSYCHAELMLRKKAIKSSEDIFQEFLTVKGRTLEDLRYGDSVLDDNVKEFSLLSSAKMGKIQIEKSPLAEVRNQTVHHQWTRKRHKWRRKFHLSTDTFMVTMHLSKKDGWGSVDHKKPISWVNREKLNIYMQINHVLWRNNSKEIVYYYTDTFCYVVKRW